MGLVARAEAHLAVEALEAFRACMPAITYSLKSTGSFNELCSY